MAFDGLWSKMKAWWESFLDRLPEILLAILALILFYFISRLISKLMEKGLPKVSRNQAVNRLIVSITSVVIMIIGLFAALSILDLDKTVTSLLAGVGIVGLALGFAFQNAAANVLSGIIMAVHSPINVGDIIESYSHFGEVRHIGLRATRMTNPWGQEVEIPNRLVLQEPFEHYTYNGVRRVDIEGRVPLNEDLERVQEVVTEAVRSRVGELQKDRPVELLFMEFEEFAVKFELRCWVTYSNVMTDYFEGQSEAIIAIQKGLREADIEIPIPPRAIHFQNDPPYSPKED
ncbi:MAG: mechanosensitive ion channel family protein [Flavobacteriales bacterium]